jgi:hypothetical protein
MLLQVLVGVSCDVCRAMAKKDLIEQQKKRAYVGGSSIATWLPNNLLATLEYMDEVARVIHVADLGPNEAAEFDQILAATSNRVTDLQAELIATRADLDLWWFSSG